ncbi:MAG: MATE family efflux transporter [Wenzhouxiangella sp.]
MSAARSGSQLRFEVGRTLALAGPLIVGQLTNFGMTFVDTVMAGRLGKVDLGAVAVGSSVWAAGFLFVLGMLMAVAAAVSHLDGAGRPRQAGELTRQSLWLALVLAVGIWYLARSADWLMAILGTDQGVAELADGYLRAISFGAPALTGMLALRFFSEGIGYTRPTMYIGVLGILCNVPLNYVLMFGKLGFPAFGAVGCGWATAVVLWLQLIALVVWMVRRPRYRPYAVFARFSGPDRRELAALIRLGLPIGIMVFMEGGLFVGSALLIGTLGALPIAAHQVAINFSGLIFMVPLGLSGAITVRVGNAVGRGDGPGARRAGLVGTAIALAFGMAAAVLMFSIPEAIVRLYTADREVIEPAAGLLVLAAVFQIADCIQVSMAGALRGLKDTRLPMLYSVFAYWMIGMTLGWWLTFRQGWGPSGMWTGIIAGLSVAAVLLAGRFLRISRPARAW